MSQTIRQSNLFIAEDWRTLYQAFTQVNFNAYDFNTIRTALVDYIRINYPEDFNDWTENSEFVSIIELLAYLGQSLAFRMDLNTRENFLDTATRRESVFRLARLLSYNPQRSFSSVGLMKLTQISTDRDVYDSNGNNLKGIPIVWNDSNNPDWYEQWIVVLNSSLISSNPYGKPVKSGVVGNVNTYLYQMNSLPIAKTVLSFTTTVGGESMGFELCNPDFNNANTTSILGTSGNFYERSPNSLNSWHVIYRNDGNGNSSANTGFFVYFKQGTLLYNDYQLDYPIENRVLDVNVDNPNEQDVWVQSINTFGTFLSDWTKVPAVTGTNVIYNALDQNIRDIFSVITRNSDNNDQISIRFADGRFGTVPTGIIRVWTRVGNGLSYQIKPQEMNDLGFSIQYTSADTSVNTLSIRCSLQNTVNNSIPRQNIQQIKDRASQVYYTQDRMVNGQDYNVFPLQSSQAIKIKAVNRTYSGHSRYIDINDPTSFYQNTNIFSDDGILYVEKENNYLEIELPTSLTNTEIAYNYVQAILQGLDERQIAGVELRDFYLANYPNIVLNGIVTWNAVTTSSGSTTGAFARLGSAIKVADYGTGSDFYIQEGAMIKFTSGKWANVISVIGEGDGVGGSGVLANGLGPITLSEVISSTDQVDLIIPAFRTTLTSSEVAAIVTQLDLNQTFGLRYDFNDLEWKVITNNNLAIDQPFGFTNAGSTANLNLDASWLLQFVYTPFSWQITSRGIRYVFESVQDIRFFYINEFKTIDPQTGKAVSDFIKILKNNTQPDSSYPLGEDYYWRLVGQQVYQDGYLEPKSVRVSFADNDNDGVVDNPFEFIELVNPQLIASKMVFWEEYTDYQGYAYYRPITGVKVWDNPALVPPNGDPSWANGDISYVISTEQFFEYSTVTSSQTNVTATHKMRLGRNNLNVLFRHYSPRDQRIDPAIMNIVDSFVITSQYDTAIRNWLTTSGTSEQKPQPPTSEELRVTFGAFDDYKMMTDQIVWHPAKYKVIFGTQATEELRAVFKVIKVPGVSLSDGEIKSQVISTINDYFAVANWDFGESFFYTELAAFIHQRLATIIGSIVIVPQNEESKFGDLFEVRCDPDEIFISGAKVTDVQIVPSFTNTVLKVGR